MKRYTIRITECHEGGWRIDWTEPGIRTPDGLSTRYATPADALEVLTAIWRDAPAPEDAMAGNAKDDTGCDV